MNTTQCIDANPDIAGIGVRVSVYVQALHLLVPIFLFLLSSNGQLEERARRVILYMLNNLHLTALALLISAFIQAVMADLDLYHSVIVVRMGWITSIGSIVYGATLVIAEEMYPGRLVDSSTLAGSGSFKNSLWLCLATINLTLTCILGIWTCADTNWFGPDQECTAKIVLSTIGIRGSVGDTNTRWMSILLYGIFVIPVANIFTAAWILTLTTMIPVMIARVLAFPIGVIWVDIQNRMSSGCDRGSVDNGLPPGSNSNKILSSSSNREVLSTAGSIRRSHQSWAISLLCTAATVQIILIFDTESMIRVNSPMILPGEDQWSFGQTLTLLLVALPLMSTGRRTFLWYREKKSLITDEKVEELEKGLARSPSLPSYQESWESDWRAKTGRSTRRNSF